MTVRALTSFEVKVVDFSPSARSSVYTGPLAALRFEAPTTDVEMERASELNAHGLGCVRGIVVALGFEAVAALSLVGIWHLWNVLVH